MKDAPYLMQVQSKAPQPARRGIFRQLLLLSLFCALMPLLAMGLTAIFVNQRALELETQARYLALVGDAQVAIENQFNSVRDDLRAVAQLLLWPGLNDEQRMTLSSSKITSTAGFDFVALYALDGRKKGVLKAKEVEVPAMPEQLPPSLMPTHAGERRIGAVVGDGESRALQVAYRYEDDQAGLIVVTHARLAPISPALASLSARLGGPDNVLVLDQQRHLVMRGGALPKAQPATETAGVFAAARSNSTQAAFLVATDFHDENGSEMVGAIASIPDLGWQVAVVESAARAKWALSWLRGSLAAALVFAALFALAMALLGVRRFTRPIDSLVKTVAALSRREYQHVDDSVSVRNDELGGLASAFNDMSDALASSEATIRHESQIRNSLSRYLSSEVVERVLKAPNELQLGGQRREVTVLFADVVGFTKLSEALPPETVVAVLNEHFTVATQLIHRHGGMIDKFIGDCVMAVWGILTPHPDDANRAIETAQALMRWVETQNRRWKQHHGIELQLGIGIHSGTAIAGNLGSQSRMEFTVMGDVVNVAARLEAMAQPGQILLTAETLSKLSSDFAEGALSVGPHRLRGRQQETLVYAVTA